MSSQHVVIEKLVSGGLGLGRDEQGILFVEGVLPQERVQIEEWHRVHGVRRARPARWLETSPRRRSPPCPIHETCGGCGFQHTDEDNQLQLKASWVRESLRRLGGWECGDIELVPGASWAYRHRTQIHWDGVYAGFLAARSNQLVPVSRCPVLGAPLQELLDPKHEFWRGRAAGRYTFSDNGSEVFTEDQPRAWVDLNGQRLWYHPAGFLQSHLELTEKLRAWIDETLGPSTTSLWDLYGGVGTWSQLLARRGWRVTVVESDRRLEPFARRNLPSGEWVGERVEDYLARETTPPDWVILDPPRGGSSPRVLEELLRLAPLNLLALSCNPDTFARDARRWIAAGWQNSYLGLWDFYPQTAHVEVVSVWRRG